MLEQADRLGNTPLFTAIRSRQVDCLKVLISYGCNFYHRKKNGNTCLHECAQHNSTECLIALISFCGSELFTVINKEGKRAIDIAQMNKNKEILHSLEKLHRNINYQNAIAERDRPRTLRNHQHFREVFENRKMPEFDSVESEM